VRKDDSELHRMRKRWCERVDEKGCLARTREAATTLIATSLESQEGAQVNYKKWTRMW
jgi:hypothetical protein